MLFPRRSNFVYQRSCEFILSQHLNRLPIHPMSVVKNNGWGLITYSRLAELHGIKADEVPLLFRCRDGFTIYNGQNYCIAYNDGIDVADRIFFTLMHEIGHITLGHFSLPSSDSLENGSDKELESEAHYFASNVLAPFIVMKRCGLTTVESLHSACKLSFEAAEIRLAQFARWNPCDMDFTVGRLLDEYIKLNVRKRARLRSVDISCDDPSPSII